jgi:uncharacterized protein YndB with AHSA1/START domain
MVQTKEAEMASQQVDETATTPASPDVVYRLLRDGATWPQWSPIDSFELERAAEDEPEGLGAIRVFRTGRYVLHEEIVELVPKRRFSYALRSGIPVRGYRADVDLEPEGEGTKIRWRTSFDPKVPGTGWLIRRRVAGITERFVRGLAAHAAALDKAA